MRNFIIIVFSFFIVSCGLRLRTPFTQPANLSTEQLDNLNVNVEELSTNQFYWKLRTDSRFAWDYERYLMNQDYRFWNDYYWNNRLWMNGYSNSWHFYNARWRYNSIFPYQNSYYNNWMWNGFGYQGYGGGWNNYNNWFYFGNVHYGYQNYPYRIYQNPNRLLINGRRGPSMRVETNSNRRNRVRTRRVNRGRNDIIRESNNNIIRESSTPTRVRIRNTTPRIRTNSDVRPIRTNTRNSDVRNPIRTNNSPIRTRNITPTPVRTRTSAPSRTSGNTTVIKTPSRSRRNQ